MLRSRSAGAAPEPGLTPGEIVAANFSRLRLERRESISAIARRAGLAKGTLSKLELGLTNPTVETLFAIAEVLQVGVSQLVSQRTDEVYVERAGDAHWVAGDGVEERQMSHVFGAALIETYELRLTGERREAEPHAPGTHEHFFLISGRALVGPTDAPQKLAPGDWIGFPGDRPHVYQALRGGAHAHLVMSIPQPSANALEALSGPHTAD
jgi:transcriptional regulator with XRE-family HTH domain